MKIQAKEQIQTLDGKNVVDQNEVPLTVGQAISNMLLAPRKNGVYVFDKMKSYILAQKFYEDKDVEIDAADLKNLRQVVETDTLYGPLVSGRVLIALDKE